MKAGHGGCNSSNAAGHYGVPAIEHQILEQAKRNHVVGREAARSALNGGRGNFEVASRDVFVESVSVNAGNLTCRKRFQVHGWLPLLFGCRHGQTHTRRRGASKAEAAKGKASAVPARGVSRLAYQSPIMSSMACRTGAGTSAGAPWPHT